MAVNFLVLIFVANFIGIFGDCNKSSCPSIPLHYEELGCKPILNQGDCCPKSFDCSHLSKYSNDKCYFKGQAYEANSKLSDSALQGSCIGAAHCSTGGKFIYAHIDCAEYFRGLPQSGCIRQYTRDRCCSTALVCGDDMKKLPTCALEGKTYRLGEKMYPSSDKCYTCYCTNVFNSALKVSENPDCVKAHCKLELFNPENIRNQCVPVYHKDSCCPSNWKCPSSSDAVVTGNQGNSGLKCKFGSLELKVGDSLAAGENKCQKCTCEVPPMVTCRFVDC